MQLMPPMMLLVVVTLLVSSYSYQLPYLQLGLCFMSASNPYLKCFGYTRSYLSMMMLTVSLIGGPTAPIGELTKRSKRKIKLPWDISSFFSEQLPEGDDEDDEEEQEANAATLERLKLADRRTRGMTKDEYVHYSECRQASFTYKKAKRFREWAGFGTVTDSKPNDDVVDILGFLLYDIVQTLTEEALRVKAEEDRYKARHGGSDQSKKRKRQTGLFDPPEEGTTPVTAKHVREAFRRLQEKPIPGRCRVWMGPETLKKTELKLVSSYDGATWQLAANEFLDLTLYFTAFTGVRTSMIPRSRCMAGYDNGDRGFRRVPYFIANEFHEINYVLLFFIGVFSTNETSLTYDNRGCKTSAANFHWVSKRLESCTSFVQRYR